MATISVGSGNYLRPYRNVRIANFPEDASQSFKRGAIVIYSATSGKENKIKEAGADPTALMLGVCLADASGTEGTMLPVALFTPDAEFVIHMVDTQTLDRSKLGTSYGVLKDGTYNIWRLDNTETTAKVFVIVQLLDAHGDANGRCVVRPTTATQKLTYGAN
jgi:hypothetical protein